MTGFIRYKDRFSVADCKANPTSLYVFGDNYKRCGKGGQAIIRDLPNSIGIATKRVPSMAEGSFFTEGMSVNHTAQEIGNVFSAFATGDYEYIILPIDGLGTGLAELQKRAPHILEIINKVFYNESTD